jgi:hypothetical protein
MTSQLLKAKQAGAEAVLTYGIGPELAQIANGMEKLGWKVPMIGSWTLAMANFVDNAGKNGERHPHAADLHPGRRHAKRKAFIDAYVKAYNPPGGRMPSAVSAAQGYDSIYLLAAAMKQAGSTEGPKIAAALENLNDQGRRRRHHLQQAVQQDRPRSHQLRQHRVRRSARRPRGAGQVRHRRCINRGQRELLAGHFLVDRRRGFDPCVRLPQGEIMDILLQLVFSGIALGMIYAVIAFGYQLTFATSGTLNFGQGEALMLGALVGLSLVGTIHGGPYMSYWLMIPLVIVFGALQGMFVEWIGVRPAIKHQVRIRLDHVDHRAGHHLQERRREHLGQGRAALPFAALLDPVPVHGRQRAADAGGRHHRRARDHAGGRDLQPQVDLRQGRRRHLQRPRRRRPDGH